MSLSTPPCFHPYPPHSCSPASRRRRSVMLKIIHCLLFFSFFFYSPPLSFTHVHTHTHSCLIMLSDTDWNCHFGQFDASRSIISMQFDCLHCVCTFSLWVRLVLLCKPGLMFVLPFHLKSALQPGTRVRLGQTEPGSKQRKDAGLISYIGQGSHIAPHC